MMSFLHRFLRLRFLAGLTQMILLSSLTTTTLEHKRIPSCISLLTNFSSMAGGLIDSLLDVLHGVLSVVGGVAGGVYEA